MGLLIGKPVGVTLFCIIAVAIDICRLPLDLKWLHIIGARMLGGIGFTMSIFITMENGRYSKMLMNGKLPCLLESGICIHNRLRKKLFQLNPLDAYAKHSSWKTLSASGKTSTSVTQDLTVG